MGDRVSQTDVVVKVVVVNVVVKVVVVKVVVVNVIVVVVDVDVVVFVFIVAISKCFSLFLSKYQFVSEPINDKKVGMTLKLKLPGFFHRKRRPIDAPK